MSVPFGNAAGNQRHEGMRDNKSHPALSLPWAKSTELTPVELTTEQISEAGFADGEIVHCYPPVKGVPTLG